MLLKETGLTTQQVIDLTEKYMIETYARFPFVAERAEGVYIYDTEGNAWLDFYAGIAVNSCGNCNPKVTKAIQEQAGQIVHTFNYPYSIPQAVLAKFICETIGMDKIFYQNSGTEANEAMIKLARKYGVDNFGPNRYEIITAIKGFHGRTYGAMSATGQPGSAIHKGFEPLLPGFKYVEYNNLKAWEDAITPNTIAFMLEPVQGEGGVIPAKPEFLQGLRELADKNNMLLCFDEVQTGWGRTGSIMAFMGYGVKPDIVSMAKAMGNGVAIGAICATAKVATAFGAGAHGSTFGGSILNCAGSYAAVTTIVGEKLYENAGVMGDYLAGLFAKMPHVKEVRHRGLLVGVEFDAPKGLDIKHGCVDRKMLVTAIGTSVIRVIPPLVITKADCDECAKRMTEAVKEAYGE